MPSPRASWRRHRSAPTSRTSCRERCLEGLRALGKRGRQPPGTLPTDGAPGFSKAIDAMGPRARRRRCGFPPRQPRHAQGPRTPGPLAQRWGPPGAMPRRVRQGHGASSTGWRRGRPPFPQRVGAWQTRLRRVSPTSRCRCGIAPTCARRTWQRAPLQRNGDGRKSVRLSGTRPGGSRWSLPCAAGCVSAGARSRAVQASSRTVGLYDSHEAWTIPWCLGTSAPRTGAPGEVPRPLAHFTGKKGLDRRHVLPLRVGLPPLRVRGAQPPLRRRWACPLPGLLPLPGVQERTGLPPCCDASLPTCRGLRTPAALHRRARPVGRVWPAGAGTPAASATSQGAAVPALPGARSPLRPPGDAGAAASLVCVVSQPPTPPGTQDSIRLGARPDPTRTLTLQETPSFSWRDNAGPELLPEAGATLERRLEAVSCKALFGQALRP